MHSFSAIIKIIGVNPYVDVPEDILQKIFTAAGKSKGHVPVKLEISKQVFTQHLVRYAGAWRLYLNTPMRKLAGKETGDRIAIKISFDPDIRETPMHPKLRLALDKHKDADRVYQQLSPSLQKEIRRYINHLKSETSIENNIARAIRFLLGEERFIGRDHP